MGEPRFLVSRDFHFDAAHSLPNYQGQCEKLHGHRWQIRITVKAPIEPESGIAVDFHEIDRVVRDQALGDLDHTLLNDLMEHPSAENTALFLWQRLAGKLPLELVEVWETPRSRVAYRPGL